MSDTGDARATEAELRAALEPCVSRHPNWPESNRIAVQRLSAAITELVALRAVADAAEAYRATAALMQIAALTAASPTDPVLLDAVTASHRAQQQVFVALAAARQRDAPPTVDQAKGE